MQDTGDIALAGAGRAGWMERSLRAQRRRLFEAFLLFRRGAADETVLDVSLGSAPPGLQERADAPAGSLVTSCVLEAGRAPHLPWNADSFDWIHCAEVIEHLTPPAWQQALVAECYRVARKGVFITTSNRRHPLEFHSGLPLLHWLKPAWRGAVGRFVGAARRIPPALIDASRLYDMAAVLPGAPAHDVGHKRVLGLKAHFFLMIRKGD